eukprot:m.886664 g.886664  ORF g.886664 m.886664 type:complete len:310 (+) comp23628_c0_seq2:313-1242(+)
MSYRDLRNLLESLRTLGYPRLVSIENFRDPNFPLVAEILQWLTKRYDPEVELPFAIDSQQDRVIFIKAVARFLITKGGIRLNAKKLYRADGHAVREIIKLANVLTSAMEAGVGHGDGSTPDALEIDLAEFDLSGRENDLKATRTLASEITARGAALHELLEREVDLRESRSDAIARPLDVDEIESGVQRAMAIVSDEISRTQSMMENIGADEANLENKIEKSKADYERHCKKLRALENVRCVITYACCTQWTVKWQCKIRILFLVSLCGSRMETIGPSTDLFTFYSYLESAWYFCSNTFRISWCKGGQC